MAEVVSTMAEGPKDLSTTLDEAATSLGYTRLKEEQKALFAFVTCRDVFVSLPIGYSKLCYALLPFIFDVKRGLVKKKSVIMVVLPLIALMKDQSSSFAHRSITAGYISDKETTDKETKRKILRVESQLVLISPETLFLAIE